MLRPRRPPAARAARAPLSHGGRATAEDRRSPSAAAGIARRSVRASLRELSRRSVGQRLGHMLLVDGVGVRQRRNRPGYASHPRPATARERQPLDRSVEKRGRSICSLQRVDRQDGGGPQPRERRRRSKAPPPLRRAPQHVVEAARRRGRSGRATLARASPERPPAAEPSTGNPRRRRRARRRDTCSCWRRAGSEPERPPSLPLGPRRSRRPRAAGAAPRARVAGIPEARRGRARRDARAWPHPASGQDHPRRSPPPTRCDGVTETGACRSAAARATGDRRRSGCV